MKAKSSVNLDLRLLRASKVGAWMELERRKAGATQAEVASAVGRNVRSIQLWEKGNVLPPREVFSDFIKFLNAGSGKGIMKLDPEVEWATLMTSAASSVDGPKTSKTSTQPSAGHLSASLKAELKKLGLKDTIKAAIETLLSDRLYPTRMVLSGDLIQNPIWKRITRRRREQLLLDYPISQFSGPRIMHLDLLLVRANDKLGHGKLFTYYSKDWKTYLIPFRQRKLTDHARNRPRLNAERLAHFNSVPADRISVRPIPGKFLISVKPHAKHGELILYIFECCSVEIALSKRELTSALKERPHGGDRTPPRWRYMQEMRADLKSEKVNGDVVRAINEMFAVTLEHLPVSVIPSFVAP